MAVRVRLAGTLKAVTGGRGEVLVSGGSLRAIIREINRMFPDFKARIVGTDGNLKKSVVVHVNGTEAGQLQGIETIVREADEVLITIPLAGG